MVKRAHRSLKAALMARCTDEKWKEQVPLVLLGLRTTPKANGDTSPVKKVYGETLAVPGEFFPPLADGANATPPPEVEGTSTKSSAYVFVRVDACSPPLTRPYRGPHRVIRRASKAFLLDIHGWEDWLTIDRLKPAFLLDSKICEEVGRHPRVPPQYLPEGTPASPPKWGPGQPRKHIQPSPGISSTPRPQFFRSRGPLLLPQRLQD
ncbi:uncharacterized protein [Macrobrachium rosenbergii]|uniref:uncharacterized protein n=1 Tax=Macrobrachium rosenbergii TaxID=79674 RepID=UPI0034D3A681